MIGNDTEVMNLIRRLWRPGRGHMFRTAFWKYGDMPKIVDGNGALANDGRWLRAGVARAVQGSRSAATSMKEYETGGGRMLTDFRKKFPCKTRVISYGGAGILDLTDSQVALQLGLVGEWWKANWRSPDSPDIEVTTQRLGRLAFMAGASGLLVPSDADAQGVNVVLFIDNIKTSPGDYVRLDDDQP